MGILKNKYSVLSLLVLIRFNEERKDKAEDFLKVFTNSGYAGYEMALYRRKENKIKILFKLSIESSVELVKMQLKNIIKNYKDIDEYEMLIPRKNTEHSRENNYCLLLESKYNYFNNKNKEKFGKHIVQKIETTTPLIHVEKFQLTDNYNAVVNFTLKSIMSIDYAIDIIRNISAKEINKEYKKINKYWEKGYIVSNYDNIDESTFVKIKNFKKNLKEKEHEIANQFNNNALVVEQFSLFGNVDRESTGKHRS